MVSTRAVMCRRMGIPGTYLATARFPLRGAFVKEIGSALGTIAVELLITEQVVYARNNATESTVE